MVDRPLCVCRRCAIDQRASRACRQSLFLQLRAGDDRCRRLAAPPAGPAPHAAAPVVSPLAPLSVGCCALPCCLPLYTTLVSLLPDPINLFWHSLHRPIIWLAQSASGWTSTSAATSQSCPWTCHGAQSAAFDYDFSGWLPRQWRRVNGPAHGSSSSIPPHAALPVDPATIF